VAGWRHGVPDPAAGRRRPVRRGVGDGDDPPPGVLLVDLHDDGVERLTDGVGEQRGLDKVDDGVLVCARPLPGRTHDVGEVIQPVQHPRGDLGARAQRDADLGRVAVREPAQRCRDMRVLRQQRRVEGLLGHRAGEGGVPAPAE
jgi:hypothetical protein